MLWVFTDYSNLAFSSDYLALIAHRLYWWSYFHGKIPPFWKKTEFHYIT